MTRADRYILPLIAIAIIAAAFATILTSDQPDQREALRLCQETNQTLRHTIEIVRSEAHVALAMADAQNKREARTQQQLSICLEINAAVSKGCVK